MVCRSRLIITCLLWSVALCAVGQSVWYNKITDLPAIGVPMVNLSPETGWVFGGAVQGYFRCQNQGQTSMVQLSGAWSVHNQWYVHSKGTIYLGKERTWIVKYNVGYRYYPDTYFLPGNRFEVKPGQSYQSRRVDAEVSALAQLGADWYMGGKVHYLYEDTNIEPVVSMAGIGAVACYDTRDVHFYPSRGLFFQTSVMHYESLNGHFARMQSISSDLRQFVTIYKDLIFAWQLRTQWTFGKDIPFQLQPTLGGEDLIRGVRANMFRDQALMALQGELRIPLYRQLSGTVFAGVGDVYNYHDWQWTMPKVGYGLGLRFAINKAKVNIRFDVARNNLYRTWNTWDSYSFYLSATEAF